MLDMLLFLAIVVGGVILLNMLFPKLGAGGG